MEDFVIEKYKFRRGVTYTLGFIFLLWLVKILELATDTDLSVLGIYPRSLTGSVGIFTAPLVHGDWIHLISNSFPLFVLGLALLYFFDKIALEVIVLIYLITDFWVWIIAREAYHIGSSGLVYGLISFLLFLGLFRRDRKSLSISLLVIFIYGGTIISGILPLHYGVSWESHLMGVITGMLVAYYYRKSRMKVPKPSEDPSTVALKYTYVSSDDSVKKKEPLEYPMKKKQD